jgi:oxygen-independent coproporphyrinogen-3 oxidase
MKVTLNREHFINQYPPFNVVNTKEVEGIFARKPVHLYVHTPFCPHKCGHCYYKSFDNATAQIQQEYLERLKQEILLYSRRPEVKNKQVKSLYFGGGSPTIMTCKQLEELVTVIFDNFDFAGDFEFCSEARPHAETLTEEKLNLLKRLQVNRLSFGVQNFNPTILELNQRVMDLDVFYKVYEIAKKLKFKIINIDIMSGMYGETPENWEKIIDRLLELAPESIVFYKMELFYNTKLFKDMKNNKAGIPLMSNAEEIQIIHRAFDRLQKEGGYMPANCFNLVKAPEFIHKHRKKIWRGDNMKGLGLTAHSCCDGYLYQNTTLLKEYHQLITQGKLPIKRAHRLTIKEEIAQTMIYGIKSLVIDRKRFMERYGFDMTELYGETLRQLIEAGYLTLDEEALRVPPNYYLFADDICREFFLPEHETMMMAHVPRG